MEKTSENPIVTIIVPIYNTEKYLEQCLTSISLQTYQKFEVLLIDDGSNDSCGNICDEWVSKDSRFRVLHKKNGGIASARNAGLSLRRGKYITWVDSDDWIDNNYVELLYTKIIEHDADIAINCQGNEFDNRDRLFDDAILKHYLMGELSNMLWQTMVRSDLYDNKEFCDYGIGEDSNMLFRLYQDAKRIVRYKKEGYHWRIHPNSATHSLNYKKILSWYHAYNNQLITVAKTQPELKPYYSYKRVYVGSILYRNVKKLDLTSEILFLKNELRRTILNAIKYIPYRELNRYQIRQVLSAIKIIVFSSR